MKDRIEKKRLAILRVLRNSGKPVPSESITSELRTLGYDISPRTIRFHLQSMDVEGLTEYSEKHGRFITQKGIEELNSSRVYEKVGFLNARIDQMAWRMNLDLDNKKGTVVVNLSLIKMSDLAKAADILVSVFNKGFSMGQLVRLYREGERTGAHAIPTGFAGLGTVCSFTFNGVLTQAGIPIRSHFGGLLQIENSNPVRFVEMIYYNGTSIDPLEIFIKSGMTDFSGTISSGSGRIGANYFDIPEEARAETVRLMEKMNNLKLGNILELSYPGQPLLEVPIQGERVGGIAIGGLNPVAALIEQKMEIVSHAVSDITDFGSLFHFSLLPDRVKSLQ